MFFLIPVGVDYRTERLPVVTFSLIGANVLVYILTFLAMLNGGGEAVDWIMENFWLIPSQSGLHAYITTLFVHSGFLHLAGNMIYLFLFGACVEDAMGRGRFIAFYLAGGLVSDLAHILLTPGHFSSELPLGGASGAISACIGGFVVLFHKTQINFRYLIWMLRLWTGEFWLPAWLVISFWFASDLLSAAASLASQNSGGGVAFGAHVGGFLAGFGILRAAKGWRSWNDSAEETARRERRQAPAEAPGEAEPASIYLFDAGQQLGPFTNGQVVEMITLRSVTEEALYWHAASQQWRRLEELHPREGGFS